MAAISQVIKRHPAGLVDYQARIYLGHANSEKVIRISCRTDELIQRRWRLSAIKNGSFWELCLRRIKPGTALFFRLELDDGRSIPFVPLGESDVVNGVVRVPDFHPSWLQPKNQRLQAPATQSDPGMAILLEHPLEGLLAEFDDGVYFTDAVEELLPWSIADRILQTTIPEQIRDLGYTEIMFPLYASVADRCHLEPKFNYLVYNLSADWQLGTAQDMRKLVQRFRSYGIELVPDLVFVHQVNNPYAGSSHDVSFRENAIQPYRDPAPSLFRDYGTWYFDLEDPLIREILIDKIVETILVLDLRVIRVDYIDGLLMQFANKPVNHGAALLWELKRRLLDRCPDLRIIGEAFQTASDPAVCFLMDSTYSPRGFTLLDLLLAPDPGATPSMQGCVNGLTDFLAACNHQSARESNYSQLHDECWLDHWISYGRPHTPWAYGAMPMGLSMARVEALIRQGVLDSDHQIPTAVALTLLVRTLGLAVSFTRWMETSGCLSLDQGRLDEADHWRFPWLISSGRSRALFPGEGLPEEERRGLLQRAREHVAAANLLFRRLGRSEANPLGVPLRMVHGDVGCGLAAFVRWGCHSPHPALVVVNLSPVAAASQPGYELDLNSAGWRSDQHPTSLQALSRPLWGNDQNPLQLSRSPGSPGHYRLSRPLHGYESALFEISIDDS